MMRESLSIRLKDLREEKGLSQHQLAKLINTSQTNISRWEKATHDPSTQWIIVIAGFFGVSTDYLLGVTDE